MARQNINQERGKKRLRGKTKAVLEKQPSKAPGEDQDVTAASAPIDRSETEADGSSSRQGISNRPANEEHAFANPNPPEATERTIQQFLSSRVAIGAASKDAA